MGKEEFIKAITKLPKTKSSNSLSSMHSINIDDLISTIERFNKIPTYDELLKENQKYRETMDKINSFLDKHDKNAGKLYYKYDNKYLLSEIKEDIRDILREVE